MKLEYDYFVHSHSHLGYATVEYEHPELGSITRYMILPYGSPEEVHRRVVENFPVDEYYCRWLADQKTPIPDVFKGKISIDFKDHFYDIVNEATAT